MSKLPYSGMRQRAGWRRAITSWNFPTKERLNVQGLHPRKSNLTLHLYLNIIYLHCIIINIILKIIIFSVIVASHCTTRSHSSAVTKMIHTPVWSASVMNMPTVVFTINLWTPVPTHVPRGEEGCVLTASTTQLDVSVSIARSNSTGSLGRVSSHLTCVHLVNVKGLGFSLESWIVSRLVHYSVGWGRLEFTISFTLYW